ncbi:transposase [Halobacillus kuroshimensis]|uniref:Transposase n=1 Tax=Halobacillus kuroshimensis TaxID=302481 RepID=A0ABS3DV00_9BACI|nr:transposase [Halobacillus kuroshimensis]
MKKPPKRIFQAVERSFADSKERHGLRYFRLLGKEKVKKQALMTAACQNMKKTP